MSFDRKFDRDYNNKELQKMKKVELIERIKTLQEEAYKDSATRIKLIGELSFAKSRIEELEEELKAKNDRGAGRKKKFDNDKVQEILKARGENKSIRAIAKEFNCSIGLVQKIINEHK